MIDHGSSVIPNSPHPWLVKFQNAPEQALGELLAGYADISPYERADAPDAARTLFGPLSATDPAREALGPAIISWLESRRKKSLPSAFGKRQRHVREICEAFEIIALLGIVDAANELRRHFVSWNEWVGNLALSPARDARAEYWRALALTQPLVALATPMIEHWSLAPLWHQICVEAGGRLPASYLDIGLLGLRRLPAHSGGSEVPWISGLAHWALAQQPSTGEFNAIWLSLKPLYPRTPQRWRKLVGELLSTTTFVNAGIRPPAWWAVDPDFAPMSHENFKILRDLRSPFPRDCDQVIARFGEPFNVIEPFIDHLMLGHRHYLYATGDSRFMVRAIHALGQGLIETTTNQSDRRAEKAQALAREGLGWQANNPYLWQLWRDALTASGDLQSAEWIGWEFIRRLPENVESRTQLATLLATCVGRPDEAEILLKDTVAKFPDAIYARTQLAELLIAQGRKAEASYIIDALFADIPADAHAYALRARLYSSEGFADAAMAAIRQGLEADPSGSVLNGFLATLQRGEPLPLVSLGLKNVIQAQPMKTRATTSVSPDMDYVLRLGKVRKLRLLLDSGEASDKENATREIRAFLNDDPTFAYAELLATRHRLWEAESELLPTFAISFENALATENRVKLEELATSHTRLQALILVARTVIGDIEAADKVESWLRQDDSEHEDRPVAVLRAGLHSIFRSIECGRSTFEIFAENRAIAVRALHDANEVTIGDILLAA